MKQIIIELNDKYIVPSNIQRITADEWEIIISSVDSLLLKHDAISTNIVESEVNQMLEAKYQEQISALETQLETQTNEMTNLKNKYSKQLKKQKKDLEDLNKANIQAIQLSLKDTEKTKDTIILSLKAQIEELQKSIHDSQSKMQESILEKLEPITRFYGGTNSEKGISGESSIHELLLSYKSFNEAIIEDVSSQSSSGDLLYTYKSLKCLIKIKNKSKLVSDDMEKFIRDITISTKTRKINAGLFISLQTSIFPGRSQKPFQFDYINGVPVIYAYMPPPSSELHAAITYLENIVQQSSSIDNTQIELQRHVINYFNDTQIHRKQVTKELNEKRREVKSLTKQLDHLNDVYNNLYPICSKLSSAEEKSKDSSLLSDEDILDRLAHMYIDMALKNEAVTIELLYNTDIPTQLIDKFDIETIAAAATKIYIAQQLTEQRIELLCEFYSTYGRYPLRKELSKIIPDNILRHMTRISKSKKISETIAEYMLEHHPSDPPAEEPVEEVQPKKRIIRHRQQIEEPDEQQTDQ